MTYINHLKQFVNEEVTLKGWVYNYRSSKALQFIELRDGSGLCQCIVAKDDVPDEVWGAAGQLKQESSVEIKGKIITFAGKHE